MLARLSRLTLEARSPMVGSFAGQHRSPHRGASVEFAQYRRYVPGDDPSKLDWRAYARSDRFYIKEFEADTNLRCCLVLDASGSMGYRGGVRTKFELARSLAGSLAHLAVQQGDAVGLTCFNNEVVEDVPPRTSPKHLKAIYDVLERVDPAGETDIVGVLHNLAERVRRRALVVVVSDFFCEPTPLLDCFQHLLHRKHDLAAFQILDETELAFDFDRPMRFRDLEGGAAVVADPAVMRRQYLKALTNHQETLRAGCLRYNIDYRRVLVGEGCERVLSQFLLDRMKRK